MTINLDDISGNKRQRTSLLDDFIKPPIASWAQYVPSFIKTYHLTTCTLILAILAMVTGYLAQGNKLWFLANSGFILIQFVTDILDGAVGRRRKTGLVFWGFYMDHFFDFLFTQANFAALMFAFPHQLPFFILGMVLTAGFFVHEGLKAVINGTYNVHGYNGVGGHEQKLMSATLFAVVAIWPGVITLTIVKILFALFVFSLIKAVFVAQKKFWELDMENKRQ